MINGLPAFSERINPFPTVSIPSLVVVVLLFPLIIPIIVVVLRSILAGFLTFGHLMNHLYYPVKFLVFHFRRNAAKVPISPLTAQVSGALKYLCLSSFATEAGSQHLPIC